MTLKDFIKQECSKNKMTILEFQEKVGISNSYYSHLLKRKQINVSFILKLQDVLKLDVNARKKLYKILKQENKIILFNDVKKYNNLYNKFVNVICFE